MFKLSKGESGFTFIEVLIVICVLMIFVPGLFLGLQTSSHAAMKADGMATAEALAKSEIEYIMAQPYQSSDYTVPSTNGRPPGWAAGNTIPAGYTLTATFSPITADMQQVSVNVTRASGNSWIHVDYTVTDYWRNPS